MKPNIGSADRIVRIVAGLGILGAGYYFKNWWGLVGLLPILTAVVRFCPAYLPFGINTCGAKRES
ncbi:MAG: DUF2892 domain-containing protein [Opitutaceae bacterium]